MTGRFSSALVGDVPDSGWGFPDLKREFRIKIRIPEVGWDFPRRG